MNNGLYDSKKTLTGSGSEIKSGAAADAGAGAAGAAAGADGADGAAGAAGAGGATGETDIQKQEREAAEAAAGSAAAAGAGGGGGSAGAGADSAGAAGAGAAGETDVQKQEREKQEKIVHDAAMQKILDGLGVKTLAELKDKIPAKQETDEEKRDREEREKVGIIDFAVRNKRLTTEQISALDNMRATEKLDLAFQNFSKEYKELHKGRVADDQKTLVPVTNDEIEESFNELFHINSDSSALKKTGQTLLDQYVKGMFAETEQTWNQVAAEYKDFEARKAFFPEFKTFMKSIVTGFPKELTFGAGDGKLVFNTDKLDLSPIEAKFSNNDVYNVFFMTQGDQSVRDRMKEDFTQQVIARNIDAIIAEAREAGKNEGREEGSNTGAREPFGKKQDAANQGEQKQSATELSKTYRQDQAKHYNGQRR